MHLVYEDTKEELLAIGRRAKHQPPHLHQTLELVYVMKGSLELGVGLELFHMEEGDIGLVFPDVNHHCQVFSEQYSEVLYINIPTRTLGTYEELLKRKAPVYPVIKYGELPSEIYPAIQSMKGSVPKNIWIVQAYLQVIFVRCIPLLTLTEKSQVGSNDLIYQTVSYISANFRKSFLLEDMAKDLGVSMCYQGYFPKLFTGISISILMTQDLVMQSNGWKIPMIRLQISVWTVALKARELLTGCLRKNTWSHRVSIVENYMKIWKK